MTGHRVIGLIAGSGEFPLDIAEAIIAAGDQVFVLGLRGFYDRRLRRYNFASIDLLDPEKAIAILRERKLRELVLAGGVRRPGPSALLSIYSAYRHRDELKLVLQSGDDTVLRGVVSFLEDKGFSVLGVDDVAPAVLAPLGQIAHVPVPQNVDDSIQRAIALMSDLGRYDVGQSIVIAGHRVLAIEGPEGTDMMLRRVCDMQKSKRVKMGAEVPLLVKLAKPEQDRRVDLPAIGPKTVKHAKAAGLAGIVVAAGDVVLVERRKLIDAADRAGLFLSGVTVR